MLTHGNFYSNSEAAIDRLVADIEHARESVHIAFYIWLDDDIGPQRRELPAQVFRLTLRPRDQNAGAFELSRVGLGHRVAQLL